MGPSGFAQTTRASTPCPIRMSVTSHTSRMPATTPGTRNAMPRLTCSVGIGSSEWPTLPRSAVRFLHQTRPLPVYQDAIWSSRGNSLLLPIYVYFPAVPPFEHLLVQNSSIWVDQEGSAGIRCPQKGFPGSHFVGLPLSTRALYSRHGCLKRSGGAV